MDNKQNHCKTFRIGDGMKSISVSDCYFAELDENSGTLLLYNPETNNIWIRISVITVEPKDKTENPMFDYNINLAKEQGKEIEIAGDKSYFYEFLQSEEELDDFHESGKTLKTIQKFLDEEKYRAENTAELQSLGIAFGDYIQYKYPNFQWSILHDQYGRDFCLVYGKTTITIFPQTMISKRVEDGEKFNVESLLKGILKTVTEMVESNNYK